MVGVCVDFLYALVTGCSLFFMLMVVRMLSLSCAICSALLRPSYLCMLYIRIVCVCVYVCSYSTSSGGAIWLWFMIGEREQLTLTQLINEMLHCVYCDLLIRLLACVGWCLCMCVFCVWVCLWVAHKLCPTRCATVAAVGVRRPFLYQHYVCAGCSICVCFMFSFIHSLILFLSLSLSSFVLPYTFNG